MGIETPGREPEETGDKVTIDRRLWLTKDRDRVVEDGDPEAASLYSTPGKRVPREEAEALGVVKPQRKQAAKAEDKKSAPAENKAKG